MTGNRAQPNQASGIFSDIETLRLDPADFAVSSAEIAATVPVRKPKRDEYFRVNPDPLMSMATSVYIDKDEGDTYYLVAPGMRGALTGEYRAVVLVRLRDDAWRHGRLAGACAYRQQGGGI